MRSGVERGSFLLRRMATEDKLPRSVPNLWPLLARPKTGFQDDEIMGFRTFGECQGVAIQCLKRLADLFGKVRSCLRIAKRSIQIAEDLAIVPLGQVGCDDLRHQRSPRHDPTFQTRPRRVPPKYRVRPHHTWRRCRQRLASESPRHGGNQ